MNNAHKNPFLDAVETNDFEKIQQLLVQHSDVIVCRQAAEEAAEQGHVECLELLLPHCGSYTFDEIITSAVARRQPDVVRTLVAHYPPETIDIIRIERAFEKTVCEDSLNAVLPYLSTPQRFSLIVKVSAPMSERLVRACIDGIDPLRGNSVMLAWGAVYNDARFDVLYPICDPTQAVVMLHKIESALGANVKYNIAEAVERIKARMQRDILEEQVYESSSGKTVRVHNKM